MSAISVLQNELDGESFNSPSQSDPIRFQADLYGDNGVIINIDTGEKIAYFLTQKDASTRIRSTYFPKEVIISISPLGFDLYEENGNPFVSFINEYWIQHQDAINEVLEFLESKGDNGRSYDEELLFPALRDGSLKGKTLDEGYDVLSNIMDMLVREGVVSPAVHLGKSAISYSPRIKKAIEERKFTWI